jgi:two-component system, NtrC family, sensor histidine kinase HydH
MIDPRSFRPYARLGMLATTLALAAALVIGALLNHRGTRAAIEPLNRGQLDVIEVLLRGAFHPWDPSPDAAALETFMAAHPEAGVRYLGIFDPAGALLASAGTAALAVAAPDPGTGPRPGASLTVSRGRVRAYVPRPYPRAGGGPGPPQFAFVLVEFEPIVANALVAQAARSVVLAVTAAMVLTLAALVFWRQSTRHEAERQALEHQRRLSQVGEMSAVLAHEIRNPLASLKGNAQLLVERLAGHRELARAERITQEATRLQALTADLLDFARSGPIEHQPTDPGALMREAVDEVGAAHFRTDTGDAPTAWPMDAPRMRQALVNLLRNAAQVSPDDRPAEARVTAHDGRLLFAVRDFGPGIAEDAMPRIFDPFYTTRTNGTGLGLAVARRVVELHGGELSVENHAGGGAEFRIVMPAGSAED